MMLCCYEGALVHDTEASALMDEGAAPAQDPTGMLLPRELLVLDALFLCAYLCHMSGKLSRLKIANELRSIFRVPELEARTFLLYRDLMVMENQVPMSLLLQVMKQLMIRGMNLVTLHPFAHGKRSPFAHGQRSRWKKELRNYVATYHRPNRVDALWKCSHILASTYTAICGGYKPKPPIAPKLKRTWSYFFQDELADAEGNEELADVEDTGEGLPPSASTLKLHGIKFKGVDRPFRLGMSTMLFKRRTVLLPTLVMDDHTASLLRNLALYEQVETPDEFDLRYYLHLMDSLIDSACPGPVRGTGQPYVRQGGCELRVEQHLRGSHSPGASLRGVVAQADRRPHERPAEPLVC